MDDELRALPLLSFHVNDTAHKFHDALGDRHAQARALDIAHRAVSLIGIKYLGRKLRRHTYARILDAKRKDRVRFSVAMLHPPIL